MNSQMPKVALFACTLVGVCSSLAFAAEIRMTPISLRSPDGSGWEVIQETDLAITYKLVQGTNTSLARAGLFHVLDDYQPDRFASEVRENVLSTLGDVRSVAIDPMTTEPYPCVKAKAIADVVPMKDGVPTSTTRTVQYRIRICRLPMRMNFGFAALYSYTSDVPIESSDATANKFLDSVYFFQQ